MKKFTFFFLLVVASFSLRAQTIYLDDNLYNLEFTSAESGHAQTLFHNGTSQLRTFKWLLTVSSEPTGWQSQVCDTNACYGFGTTSATFLLHSGSEGLMSLSVYPNSVQGQATYHLLIYDIADSANYNTEMTVNVNVNDGNAVPVIQTGSFVSLYPNPAKDVLNVSFDAGKHVSSIVIYNVVGQKMKTVTLDGITTSTNIDVSELKKGIYFLRLLVGQKEISTKTFSKE